MVKKLFLLPLSLALGLFSSVGCGVFPGWGEGEPLVKVAQVESGGAPCPEVHLLVKGNEEESLRTLECWIDQADKIWTQVEGKYRDALLASEIEVLIRKRIVRLGGTPEKDVEKVRVLLRLAGMSQHVTRSKVDKWKSWFRSHRSELRELYQKLSRDGELFLYADIEKAARLLGGLGNQMSWKMSSSELGRAILTLVEFEDPYIRRSIQPLVEMGFEFLNMICPNLSSPHEWVTRQVGLCAQRVVQYFEPGKEWVEFVINPALRGENWRKALDGLDAVTPRVEQWFSLPTLKGLQTQSWVRLSESLGAPAPEFVDSLKWINRYRSRSSENFLHPAAMKQIFKVFKRYYESVLAGVPFYLDLKKKNLCGRDARTWMDCTVSQGSDLRGYPELIRAMKVRNLKYAQDIAPLDGRRFSKIMFYQAVAQEIVSVFDEDGNALISTNTNDESDEVLELIHFSLMFVDNVDRLWENIRRKMDGKPIIERGPFLSFNDVNMKGLARLITLSHDVFVVRTKPERNFLEKLLSNLTNSFPGSTRYLDDLAITAILNTVDLMGEIREAFLDPKLGIGQEEGPDETLYVDKADFRRKLPDLLKAHFPRTYESCQRFDFERSCAIALPGTLSEDENRPGWVPVGNLDVMTLLAMGFEGLVDSCDEDGDGHLKWALLDGQDELDCGYSRAKSAVGRLLDSRLINANGIERRSVKFFLGLIDGTFISRPIGKIAMVRGTKRHAWVNLPFFWLFREASIGSMYSLLAEIVEPGEVKQLRKARGNQVDPEDAPDWMQPND